MERNNRPERRLHPRVYFSLDDELTLIIRPLTGPTEPVPTDLLNLGPAGVGLGASAARSLRCGARFTVDHANGHQGLLFLRGQRLEVCWIVEAVVPELAVFGCLFVDSDERLAVAARAFVSSWMKSQKHHR